MTGIRCGLFSTLRKVHRVNLCGQIGEVKHEQLPRVVMADDFDSAWAAYMDAYNACQPEDFLSELQIELDTRMERAAQFK